MPLRPVPLRPAPLRPVFCKHSGFVTQIQTAAVNWRRVKRGAQGAQAHKPDAKLQGGGWLRLVNACHSNSDSLIQASKVLHWWRLPCSVPHSRGFGCLKAQCSIPCALERRACNAGWQCLPWNKNTRCQVESNQCCGAPGLKWSVDARTCRPWPTRAQRSVDAKHTHLTASHTHVQ